MNDDRDPTLLTLFADHEQNLTDSNFTDRVFAQIESQKRRAMIGWSIAGLVLLPCAWLLMSSMQGIVYLLAQGLTVTLIDLEQGWLALLLSPINSVAGLLAIGFKLFRMAYKRLFS